MLYDSEGFAPEVRKVYIMSQGVLYTWSTQTGKLLRRLPLEKLKGRQYITSSGISRDVGLIVANLTSSYKDNGVIGVFDARTGKRLYILATEEWGSFSPSGKEIKCMGRTKPESNIDRFSIFDARTGRLLWQCPQDEVLNRSFELTSRTVFTRTKDEVILHDIRTGVVKRRIAGPVSTIQEMKPSPDGSKLWTSHENGEIWSWRIQ